MKPADDSYYRKNNENHSPTADPVLSLAGERFGIRALTPLQRFVIANTIERINQLVVLPTGAGKSVCFLLPSILLPGLTLVVVPLLSLLQDQVRRLTDQGIPCEYLRGGQTGEERSAAWQRLETQVSRIVFVTPEMLVNGPVLARLNGIGVAHFVVDEAHCISEWGKSFRPAYRKLDRAIRALRDPLVSAFTATASPDIVVDIEQLLFEGRAWKLVDEAPDRPNLFFRVLETLSKNALLTHLAESQSKPMVIFTRSRNGAELQAKLLRRRLGTEEIFFYHAGLSKSERQRVEQWFFGSKDGILCATSAYGMGIDKPDIRTIIHRDVPPSIESYMQESGRAGRDGAPSTAVLVRGYDDDAFLQTIDSPLARERYRLMIDYGRDKDVCLRNYLLRFFGHDGPKGEKCPGCGVCSGEQQKEPEGETTILSVIARSPRRYTKRELIALFLGLMTPEARRLGLDARPGFGALQPWMREDIEEALETLEAAGRITAPLRGFFKHRYRLRKGLQIASGPGFQNALTHR